MLTGAKQQKRFKRLMLHRIKWPAYVVGEHGKKAKAEASASNSGTGLMASYKVDFCIQCILMQYICIVYS